MNSDLQIHKFRHLLASFPRKASLDVRKLPSSEWKQQGDAWLVSDGETKMGVITKVKSSKLDLYPWKVFKYTQGPKAKYMGALYDRNPDDWSQVLLNPPEAIQQLVAVLSDGRNPSKGYWRPYISGQEVGMTKRQRRSRRNPSINEMDLADIWNR